MSFDIYGNNLRPGHCEVHPSVHEVYPCRLCMAEKQASESSQVTEYHLGQATQEIERLTAENERLLKIINRAGALAMQKASHDLIREVLAEALADTK